MRKEEFNLPSFSKEQLEFLHSSLERMYLFDSIEIEKNRLKVSLSFDCENLAGEIDRVLGVVKSYEVETIYEAPYKNSIHDSIHEKLIDNQGILKFSPGKFLLQKDYLLFFQFIDSLLYSFSQKIKAIEQVYPVLWPVELFRDIDYFKEFPQNIMMVHAVKQEQKSLRDFSALYAKERKEFTSIEQSEHLSPAHYALGTSTCDPCYFAYKNLKNQKASGEFTSLSKSFRNELSKDFKLDRLNEFHMREVVSIGKSEKVLQQREKFKSFSKYLFDYFHFEGLIQTASDPFFTSENLIKNALQSAIQSKFELLVNVGGEKMMSIGSINWHQDFFGRSFGVKADDDHFMTSSCLAFGLERFVYAFFLQHGIEEKKWPEQLRDDYGSFKEIKKKQQTIFNFSSLDKTEEKNEAGPRSEKREWDVDVQSKILSSFREHFSLEKSDEELWDLDKNKLQEWDSLNHLILISSLEKIFKRKVKMKDQLELHSSVKDLVHYFSSKN